MFLTIGHQVGGAGLLNTQRYIACYGDVGNGSSVVLIKV